MPKRFNFWLMVLNAVFFVINVYFMTKLENSTINALAAFVSLSGFCVALSHYISSEQ